jgi:competence protein ComEC
VDYGRRRFLFAADLARAGEAMLVSREGELGADVLKVGHHGSADASTMEFLNAVAPEIAVISAGEGNPYGFPHEEALARIAYSGARILRTDTDGAITVTTDGVDLVVSSYRGGSDG